MDRSDNFWSNLPYPVLYHIFRYLSYNDVLRAGEVCRYWYQVSRDDLLWKRLFSYYFNIDSSIPVIPGEWFNT